MSIAILDIFFHLDTHLQTIVAQYGPLTYAILFIILFCETGLVIMPFLPGDSLLFAAGTFAASGIFNITALAIIFILAAFLGDSVNYSIGYRLGRRLFGWNIPFLNREHLKRTEDFYARHGAKTIIIARFMPIIRTFAPFVAGIGRMPYPTFLSYNLIGGLLWVAILLFGGYLFGNIPVVRHNFSIVILLIIFLSLVPGVWHWTRSRMRKKPHHILRCYIDKIGLPVAATINPSLEPLGRLIYSALYIPAIRRDFYERLEKVQASPDPNITESCGLNYDHYRIHKDKIVIVELHNGYKELLEVPIPVFLQALHEWEKYLRKHFPKLAGI